MSNSTRKQSLGVLLRVFYAEIQQDWIVVNPRSWSTFFISDGKTILG